MRFLILLIALLSLNANAAYVGQVGTIQVAGQTLSLTGLKILHTAVTANSLSSFYDASIGATRGVYQVPSGKTFQLYAVKYEQIGAASNDATILFTLLYGTTNVGLNGSSNPTSPHGMISGATTNIADAIFSAAAIGSNVKEIAIGGSAPASSYPTVIVGEFCIITLYGYEI